MSTDTTRAGSITCRSPARSVMISTTSTGLVAWSGPWSISVSRSRSSTRRPMRLASCLIRRIASSVLASSASPPAPWSAAYPFSVTSGVRSSWEASATNWRSRAWVASFVSTSWLNAVPRSWASVPTGNASTRWLVSPELIDRATLVTRRMGSRPSRRIHQNTSAMTASRTAPTISNVVRRPVSAASMSAIERPRTRVSPEGRAVVRIRIRSASPPVAGTVAGEAGGSAGSSTGVSPGSVSGVSSVVSRLGVRRPRYRSAIPRALRGCPASPWAPVPPETAAVAFTTCRLMRSSS